MPEQILPAAGTVAIAGAAPSSTASTPETELDRAEKRYAQARARLLALRNRAAVEARKLDTRRKVILGGALIDLAARDSAAAAMLDRLTRNLPREQDRKTFMGWTPGDTVAKGTLPDTAPLR